MRALITGAAGQDGTLLSEELLALNWDLVGTKLASEVLSEDYPLYGSQVEILDITDFDSVKRVVASAKPEVIFHLAGISSVGFSIENPELTKSVNVGGVENFLKVLSDAQFSNIHFINAATVEIYDAAKGVITESSSLEPQSPYAQSKSEGYLLCRAARQTGLPTTNAILSNHESYLRPVEFVTGKIANGVARISLGLDTRIELGNIDVAKDWCSARDIVAGLVSIASKQFVGDVILASGESTNLTEIIREAFSYVGIENWHDYITFKESLIRKDERREIRIDPSLAKRELDWSTTTPLRDWVGEMVQHHLDSLGESVH
ncbi:unannotated protein [freshwater metagenome]|uniref:GDP-mannose 4,6-dehydratase n=1 Tax=freshwater metagenome TaxID=449393 RepID=A0A6J5ZFA5_9ZZZZ|nr:NAD-dependent epimerase/dehydratase family protein [Actinomycetota bacterium]MSW24735.1 NAD-dependent epimerase/dehydratase family protein [Actinomycetota bacterium]MSX28953.1 NAD-dependent epimerase/dehydratase family protein [Actinomycetota bacterium]MSX42807.1 NAD-dependent epimerase/dehydratase family protein [Actinomycetota bacterium]MSX96670.1 NAD-dependent epimerase/dehydratase family protein [Actinomycetota bacterium]